MKRPKLSFYLDTRRALQDGKMPVKIMAYYNSKQALISTGYAFSECEWDIIQNRTQKKSKMFDSSKDSNDSDIVLSTLRAGLDEVMQRADNAVEFLTKRGIPFQASDIKTEYENGHYANGDLIYLSKCNEAYLARLDDIKASAKTVKQYRGIYNSMAAYYEGLSKRNDRDKLRLVQIDAKFLRDYQEYLTNKGDSQATVSAHFRYIKALFNYAIQKEAIPKEAYPFGRGDDKVTIQGVRRTKKALTKKELETLLNYRGHLLKRQLRNFDLAILSFLLNGANMIDIAKLTYGQNYDKNSNCITFIRQKSYRTTENIVPITVHVTDAIRTMIKLYGNEDKPENYIFNILKKDSPLPPEEQVANTVRAIGKTLKCVAKKCGVRTDISYQFFRHTHATLSIKDAGASLYDIKVTMGHSSAKTTEAYISSLPDDDDKVSQMKANLLNGIYSKN